jgi:anti-sigma28 factor (negative regulator of flagellin synthesis)
MQLSREEYLRVSQMSQTGGDTATNTGNRMATASARRASVAAGEALLVGTPDVRRVTESLEESADLREDVVASLRARIESGEYQVSGEAVADMIVRRMLVDQVR